MNLAKFVYSAQLSRIIVLCRNILLVAVASAATSGLFAQPQAQAAGRRKPAVEEKKEEKVDDKGLSAYDQRLLANARRKDAMKASVEAAKAKAKSVATKD